MNKLDEILADTVLANGVQRQVALNAVRQYLSATPVERLKAELAQVTSQASLKMLQAAGVPLGLQDTYYAVLESVSGRLR
jgi:hypothetical protein